MNASRFISLLKSNNVGLRYWTKLPPSTIVNTTNVISCRYIHQSKTSKSRFGKIAKFAFAGALIGGTYTVATTYGKKPPPAIANSFENDYLLLEMPPQYEPARRIQHSSDNTGLKLTLYQYQTCPFCCKIRAYLDYYGFSYDVIEVNSVTRKQTKWTTYRKVPFLVVELPNGKVLQLKDSSMIMSALHSFVVNKTKSLEQHAQSFPIIRSYDDNHKEVAEIINRFVLMYGEHPSHRAQEDIIDERKWRTWVDSVLVHALSPNVYRTMEEAYQAFNWFSEVGNWKNLFPEWERLLVINVGAVVMYLIGKRLKNRHGLQDDVRQSLYGDMNHFLKAVKKKGTPFMGGAEPNLADISVYGVLTAIEGCDAFKDLLENTDVSAWYTNMQDAVQGHRGAVALSTFSR